MTSAIESHEGVTRLMQSVGKLDFVSKHSLMFLSAGGAAKYTIFLVLEAPKS